MVHRKLTLPRNVTVRIVCLRVAFELGHHEGLALRCLITKLEMRHISEFLKCCSSQNLTKAKGVVTGKASPRDNVFANSRCPTYRHR